MKTLVEVIWKDASTGIIQKTNDESPEDLLVTQKTYGRIYKIDNYAITICQNEDDTGEIEYTNIPIKWIDKMIKYGKHKTK